MSLALARPLPHRVAASPTDPPYDDELALPAVAACTDGSLALALPMPLPVRRTLRVVPDAARVPVRRRPRPDGYAVTPRAELPDPGPRALTLLRILLEVLAGDRPSRHLATSMSLEVLEQLERRCRSGARPWARSLRSVRVAEPMPGVAEVSAVVDRGARCSAVALRLEGLDGRWLVTALALG